MLFRQLTVFSCVLIQIILKYVFENHEKWSRFCAKTVDVSETLYRLRLQQPKIHKIIHLGNCKLLRNFIKFNSDEKFFSLF